MAVRPRVPGGPRAQAPAVKVGVLHTVTGPLAEPGQACRMGAQLAAEAINQAGGVKALGGAKLDLMLGDTQSKPEVARQEAERLVNAGAQMLLGTFSSGDTNAVVPVAQQRRVPFIVDVSAADPITANVAKSVKEGQQKVQYVYRVFPTGAMFGERAVQYMNEIFKEAGVSPKRVVVMYANDLFGQVQARSFQAAHKAASPAWDLVEVIPWPEPPADLSTEVSRLKAAKPDIIAPITRPASELCCCRRSSGSAWRPWGSSGRAALGSTRRGRSRDSRAGSSSSWTTCPGRTSRTRRPGRCRGICRSSRSTRPIPGAKTSTRFPCSRTTA